MRYDVVVGRDLVDAMWEAEGSSWDVGSRAVVRRGRGYRTLAMRRAALRPVLDSMLIVTVFFGDRMLLSTDRPD